MSKLYMKRFNPVLDQSQYELLNRTETKYIEPIEDDFDNFSFEEEQTLNKELGIEFNQEIIFFTSSIISGPIPSPARSNKFLGTK